MNSEDLRALWDKFKTQVKADERLEKLYELAEAGKATYEDARALSSLFSGLIVDSVVDTYPGQIEDIVSVLKNALLSKKYFKELKEYVSQVQTSINESLGIGLNPARVNINKQLIPNEFTPVDDYQAGISALRRQCELSSNRFIDHAQMNNAQFQANDFKITVSRVYDRVGLSDGRTCKWCLERTGTDVPYELAVKKGMFERHEGCHCEIEYNNNGIKTYQYRKGGESSWKYKKQKSGFRKYEEDIIIPKSVGAAGKNYPVKTLDGDHAKFVPGTTITKIKTIAGYGTNTEIRDAAFIGAKNNISTKYLKKMRGDGYIIHNGKRCHVEVHWYQSGDDIVAMKVKRNFDDES